jgi:hypothetical protein
MAIIRGFLDYPFPGRANPSRLNENGLLEDRPNGAIRGASMRLLVRSLLFATMVAQSGGGSW